MDICEYIRKGNEDIAPNAMREMAGFYDQIYITAKEKTIYSKANELRKQAAILEHLFDNINRDGKCDCKM